MRLFMREDLAAAWSGSDDPFEQARRQDGELYRAREGRRTLRFEAGGRSYFLKYHAGIGWQEIIKNLLQVKMPVFGAEEEYRAIEAVQQAGLATMTVAGFGVRGINPASRESFLVTDDLTGTISLEDLGERWHQQGADVTVKRALIERVGRIVGAMHRAGINHRDLYLGHFLMSEEALARGDMAAPLYLIDLHRSQVRSRVPRRWLVKDLGGLYFSVARMNFTHRDLYRFICAYTGLPLAQALAWRPALWQAARLEAERIYRRYYEVEPGFPLAWAEHPGKDI